MHERDRDDSIANMTCQQHVEEISSTSGEMKLEGFISLDGAHSKVRVRGLHLRSDFVLTMNADIQHHQLLCGSSIPSVGIRTNFVICYRH